MHSRKNKTKNKSDTEEGQKNDPTQQRRPTQESNQQQSRVQSTDNRNRNLSRNQENVNIQHSSTTEFQAQNQPWSHQQRESNQCQPNPQQSTSDADYSQDRQISRATGATSKEMSKLSLSPSKSMALIESSTDGRVYEGTKGKKCQLEVNFLQISVNKLIPKSFHYDVDFDPPTPKKLLGRALDELMRQWFASVHFAFDGRKNFYTNQMLRVSDVILDGEFSKKVIAVLGDRSREFNVKIKFATEVDMSVLRSYKDPQFQCNDKPSQAIQCLDVVLRTAFKLLTANNQAVAAGRALYFAPQQKIDLTEGMELWYGLFQSAVLGRKSLYLNVDVAHKAFPSAISIIDVIKSFNRDGSVPASLDKRTEEQLNAYLKMLTIGYRPSRSEPVKTFGYNGLVKSACEAVFVDDDGKKMTVQQYFETKKNIRLRFPHLPCLHVGSRVRYIYLPLELCEIPAGQATNKKCTPNAVASMIRYSATSTDDRKKKIVNLLNRINYSQPGGEIQGFGVHVDTRFQQVEGRVIDPPKLKYGNNGMVTPQRGVWNGKAFLETQGDTPIKWAVINCDDRTNVQKVVALKENLSKAAAMQGMKFAISKGDNDYFAVNMMRARPGEIENILDNCLKNGYKIVFVIIIDRNDCYAKVKQAAELKIGILTQCIKSNTVFRMERNPMMTINNILLKVNAKLNGKNQEIVEQSYQKFNTSSEGVMWVGADVTHPSPDQRDIPSVVGVACSYDQVGFRYQCAWRLQNPTKEIIEDLENILREHLKFYRQKNGKLPSKIMYYRDGVSEGQFAEVLSIEMGAIRGALKAIYGSNPPAKVTFIVVQKRHHTRFFPTQREFSEGKNNNIPAGTVIDKDIVHPFQYQFFLASHAAIQGVTKPCKYCVLINESNLSPDDLQAITFDLCHLFTRCNRSVSYPAPTYYAHLVAARGKQYTIGQRLNMNNLQQEYNVRTIHNNIANNSPMFFV